MHSRSAGSRAVQLLLLLFFHCHAVVGASGPIYVTDSATLSGALKNDDVTSIIVGSTNTTVCLLLALLHSFRAEFSVRSGFGT